MKGYAILFLFGVALCKEKIPTFKEAIHAAVERPVDPKLDPAHPSEPRNTHDAEEEKKVLPPTTKSKTFFEIVRINERVVVDEHQKAKGYLAKIHSAMYTIDSGRLRRLFSSDAIIKPKPNATFLRRLSANRFLHRDFPTQRQDGAGRDFDEWFDGLAKKLHLDRFWPRLLFSILLGFTATCILYLFLHGLLYLFTFITGYKLLDDGDEDADYKGKKHFQKANTSAEHLLQDEQRRIEQVKPREQV